MIAVIVVVVVVEGETWMVMEAVEISLMGEDYHVEETVDLSRA